MDAPLFIDEYHATTHLDNVNSCAYYCGILNPGKRIAGAYEFVGTRRLGKSMIRFVYFQKYEKAVFPVGFSFYKARDEWKLNGIALGDAAAEDVKAFDVTEPGK